jgi:hypothetical protein
MKLNKLLTILIIGALILLMQSLIMDKAYYQGYIPAPVQTALIPPEQTVVVGNEGEVSIKLLAEYELKGIVKGKKSYRDFASQISKYDIAIAWGDLNKEELDQHVKYSQSSRWYLYRYSPEFPEDEAYIVNNSANVHLVHADDEILKKLKKVGRDDYIILKGYLIEAAFGNGPWRSSLTRTDTGNGACEIMYVTSVEIVN